MRKSAILYHRIDFDGICSYAIARESVELNSNIIGIPCSVTPFPWNRGDELPALDGFDTVFVLDICLPVPVMKELSGKTHLVWVDHHATSIREMEDAGLGDLPGLRGTGVGACELTWQLLRSYEKIPACVELLSAYDVWDKERFDWEGTTLAFQYGMRNRYGLDAEAFRKNFTDGRFALEDGTDILSEGKAILRYVRETGTNGARSYGFDVTVAGTMKGLALLTDTGSSGPYEREALDRGAEVIVLLNRLGDKRNDSGTTLYKVSCFCPSGKPSVHLGEYLKDAYGGGGHEGAAGATLTEEQFFHILKTSRV